MVGNKNYKIQQKDKNEMVKELEPNRYTASDGESNYCLRCWNEFTMLSPEELNIISKWEKSKKKELAKNQTCHINNAQKQELDTK